MEKLTRRTMLKAGAAALVAPMDALTGMPGPDGDDQVAAFWGGLGLECQASDVARCRRRRLLDRLRVTRVHGEAKFVDPGGADVIVNPESTEQEAFSNRLLRYRVAVMRYGRLLARGLEPGTLNRSKPCR